MSNWLSWPVDSSVFPEGLADDLAPIADLADRIANDKEIQLLSQQDTSDHQLLRSCLQKLGELGLLSAEVPIDREGASNA